MRAPGNIFGIGYNGTDQMLFVAFEGGRRFKFHSVPRAVFEALADVDARDAVLAECVLGRFGWTELTPLPESRESQ